MSFVIFFVVFIILVGVVMAIIESAADSKRTPAERIRVRQQRKEALDRHTYGAINPALVCPHCTIAGKTRVKPVAQKKGISGGKATGAILTGGVSLLATGLSRKEKNTQAHCDNCNSTWII